VDKQFANQWWNFVENEEFLPPPSVDNSSLICKHYKVSVDIINSVNASNPESLNYVVLDSSDWNKLRNLYPVKNEIQLNVHTINVVWSGSEHKTMTCELKPEQCTECIQLQRKKLRKTKINLGEKSSQKKSDDTSLVLNNQIVPSQLQDVQSQVQLMAIQQQIASLQSTLNFLVELEFQREFQILSITNKQSSTTDDEQKKVEEILKLVKISNLSAPKIQFLQQQLFVLTHKQKEEKGNERLVQQPTQSQEDGFCAVCFMNQCNMVLIPCGHVCLCETCEKILRNQCKLNFCPLCYSNVSQCIKCYFK